MQIYTNLYFRGAEIHWSILYWSSSRWTFQRSNQRQPVCPSRPWGNQGSACSRSSSLCFCAHSWKAERWMTGRQRLEATAQLLGFTKKSRGYWYVSLGKVLIYSIYSSHLISSPVLWCSGMAIRTVAHHDAADSVNCPHRPEPSFHPLHTPPYP